MNNKKDRKTKSFRWFSLIVVAVLVFAVVNLVGQVRDYVGLTYEVKYYEDQLVAAQAEYADQIAQQDLLNNSAYLERMAREKLGMVKEGEAVISVIGADAADNVSSSPEEYDVDANPE